jgi:general secretion pathway protein M
MDRIQKIVADVEAWLGKLSPRERILVTSAGLAVAAFLVWIVAIWMGSGISAREARIEEKTRVVSQVGKLAEGYRRREAEKKALETRLKVPPVQLMSYVSQEGSRLGVEVTDLRRTTSPGELPGLVEDSVEVNLARIDLTRLARLLQALERGPGIVKVRRLKLTTRTDDPQLVDAAVVVSTYQLKS